MQIVSQSPQSAATQASPRDILVVARTFLPHEGGIEEYVYNRCLQDSGRVILLTASCEGDDDFDAQQAFSIYRWWMPDWLPGGALGRVLKQIFNMVGALMMSLKLHAEYRYQAIEWGHGYDFPSLWILTYLLPVKAFMYLHGNDLLCPLRSPLIQIPFALTLRRLQGIVCNSSFTENYLRSHFSLDLKTYVINPTVRPTKFGLSEGSESSQTEVQPQLIRNQYGIPESATVLLSVGRLVKRKGFDRVIKNLPHLLASGRDVHYIICGRGAMQAEFQELAERLGVSDRVHFAGFVSDSDLASYYAACDLFTMLTFFDSSASSIEGFGIVYVEAGYFGKPVLATRIGGVVDAVHHGENGWLVDPNDADGVTHALIQLCGDRPLRERLGQKGKELAQRQTPHRLIYQAQLS
ncbi:MAG: glycosyltransferase family 4 protein [Elainellaceae cyanobacterium]